MKYIPLTKGKFAIVDDEDFDRLSSRSWQYSNGYANLKRYLGIVDGKQSQIKEYMHRIILGDVGDNHVDHINGDRLDNRKENLRLCTHAENCRNSKKRNNKSSKYKGVSRSLKRNLSKPWTAQITINGGNRFLGRYAEEIEAAAAYNEAARKLFGEFAKLNEITFE